MKDETMFEFTGIKQVMNQFPKISILTSDINPLIPFWFTTKYFGTD